MTWGSHLDECSGFGMTWGSHLDEAVDEAVALVAVIWGKRPCELDGHIHSLDH